MRGQDFPAVTRLLKLFLYLLWSNTIFLVLQDTFFGRGCVLTQEFLDMNAVSNLTHCIDLIAVFMKAEYAWNAWRYSYLLCYYLNWFAKVMKSRLGFSEACHSLYQLLRNRVPEGLMGIGGSWCFSGSDLHLFQNNYCAIIDTAFKNLEYICILFFF